MDSTLATGYERVIVLPMRFAVYDALQRELGDFAETRLNYDGAILELMAPSAGHEGCNGLLERLVATVSLEWGLEIESRGSVTLKVEPYGAVPDWCFYIAHAAEVIEKDAIDLANDPPPDIAVEVDISRERIEVDISRERIEVDISRERIDKRTIDATFRVPEIWPYDGRQLRGYALGPDGTYEPIAASVGLAGIPIAAIEQFLELRSAQGQREITLRWQQWLRENRSAR